MTHFDSAPAAFTIFAICAVPLIVYLIFRRRRKDVAWGAIYILRRLLERRRRASAWKQYVVIAARTLAFAALAAAFVRPYLASRASTAVPRPPVSTHRVILVDLSPSMAAAYGVGSALDAALGFCRQVLEQAVFPGRIDILPLDGGDRHFVFDSGPIRADTVNRLMAELELTDEPADVEHGLERAVQVFRASGYARRELHLLSDFSAADIGDPEQLAGHWRTLGAMNVTPYARGLINPNSRNVAIHEFTPYVDVLPADQPTRFHVTVGYYGAAPETSVWLRIHDDRGVEYHAESLNLALGRRTLRIPLTLPAGEHLLTATVGDDDYPPDNQVARRFRAVPHLRATVLQDINLDRSLANPREWLQLALRTDLDDGPIVAAPADGDDNGAPTPQPPAQAPEGTRWQVDFANVIQAGMGLFEERDAVILVDIDRMSHDDVADARRYALRGGTVLLAPGPTADPERFNQTFAPLSPARLRPPRPETLDPDVYAGALFEGPANAILAELETVEHGNIGNARFYRTYEVRPEDLAEDARVLFALADGSPLCIFLPIGRGGTLLWTAGLGMDWHSMVVHPAYPVFLNRLITWAASRRHFPLNLAPGDPLVTDIATPRATLLLPDGTSRELEADRFDGRLRVRYDNTTIPGRYRIRSTPDDTADEIVFTVRDDNLQSDYRPLTGEMRQRLERLMGAPLYVSESALIAAMAATYPGRPLTAWAALALLTCLLLEAGLARRWFS